MKRWVARSTAGDGMTHWYVYWDGYGWNPDISKARFYDKKVPDYGLPESRMANHRAKLEEEFTMIEVELTIKELA